MYRCSGVFLRIPLRTVRSIASYPEHLEHLEQTAKTKRLGAPDGRECSGTIQL